MVTFSEYSHTLSQTTRAIKYNPATWMPNDEICAACGKTTSLWLYKKRALVMISATTKCTQPSIYNLKAEMKFIGVFNLYNNNYTVCSFLPGNFYHPAKFSLIQPPFLIIINK